MSAEVVFPEEHQTKEKVWSKPVMSIRPHHIFLNQFGYAIEGAYRPGYLATSIVTDYNRKRKTEGDLDGYWKDILGTGRKDLEKTRRSRRRFIEKILKLQDDDVISLSPEPDGICSGCPIGKHCRADNFLVINEGSQEAETISNWHADYRSLMKLTRRLLKAGFKENEDFAFVDVEHEVLDYGGRTINSGYKPVSVNIGFKAMLIEMGTLKKALEGAYPWQKAS